MNPKKKTGDQSHSDTSPYEIRVYSLVPPAFMFTFKKPIFVVSGFSDFILVIFNHWSANNFISDHSNTRLGLTRFLVSLFLTNPRVVVVAQLGESPFQAHSSAVRIQSLANVIFTVKCIEQMKIKQKRPGMGHLKRDISQRCSFGISLADF